MYLLLGSVDFYKHVHYDEFALSNNPGPLPRKKLTLLENNCFCVWQKYRDMPLVNVKALAGTHSLFTYNYCIMTLYCSTIIQIRRWTWKLLISVCQIWWWMESSYEHRVGHPTMPRQRWSRENCTPDLKLTFGHAGSFSTRCFVERFPSTMNTYLLYLEKLNVRLLFVP